MAETPAPPTPNAPPAPDLSALYGDSGKLVAAPPAAPTPAPAPAPASQDEGFLHSLATSLGLDPEQVAKTAKALKEHPAATAKAIGGEAVDEVKQAAEHPLDTAEQTLAGTRDLITNPDAQAAAKSRLASPGLGNKVTGAVEYLESGVPLLGSNIVKADEQGAAGNIRGELGTTVGTVAPFLTDEAGAGLKKVGEHAAETGKTFAASAKEGIKSAVSATAPEGSMEAGFAKLGGKEVSPSAPTLEHREATQTYGSGSPAPQKMNQVRLMQNGKEVGRVNYTLDGDTASIKAAHVDPSLRGKGYAQQMYLRAADEARDRGAKVLTSDLQGTTSLDAAQVWDKLGEKGHPVEKFESKPGSPGYRMNLKPAEEAVDPLEQLHGDSGKKVADAPARNPNAPDVSEGANAFNAERGRPPIDTTLKTVSEPFAKELADHFEELQHDPTNPDVQKTYKALKSDIDDQWNYATEKMGVKFEPWDKDGQPYKNSREMVEDVKDNHHLYFFQGGDMPADHPMAETDAKTGLTYNDKLRAVHDLFGHAAEGHQFGPAGEENAYQVHRQMFSPEAVPALTGETRAQNSWVNYGPHLRNEAGETIKKGETGYVAPKDRPFAEQKAVALDPRFTEAEPKSANADTTAKSANADNGWHQTAGKAAATDEAGGIDPRTGKSDTKGFGVEVAPELRQALDHAPTADDFKKFYDQHRDIFDKHPELRVGWDNNSAVPGGHEINVGAVGDEAARVGKKLDQKSAFDIEKGEIVPTGGTGLRTSFPNYPLEERMRDLKGENPSDIKNFEHLSKDVYDHLEPDERQYLQGNKTLQRNVMKQYHSISPSVEETTNAMQAGAALGGWWKRYIDIFQTLAEGGKQTPQGIPLYHYTGGNFEHFDPMIGGPYGDFGTHLGTAEQANSRGHNTAMDPSDSPNIRPVYANIKNPVRLEDYGAFRPDDVLAQLLDNGVISRAEGIKTQISKFSSEVDPKKLRDLIEKKGHDGIVYLNRAEGVSKEALNDPDTMSIDDEDFLNKYPEHKGNDSYIALRPEQVQPKYPAELLANTIGPSHAEVLKQWHAAVSGNKSVEDANNLAWHSYADWLDAGKPTDRKSINDIIKKNAAQPEGSEKKGNAAISDTLDKKGRVLSPGLDTNKLFNLVNSPEMRGERPFGGDVFREDAKNPLMGPTVGARKIPSMGATVAGKGNLNRLVIDAHIRDFYGHPTSGGPAAQYIADSAHLRQAAEALGLKGGEGQEQLWGTVLGLKTLLKEGLTPEEAGKKLNADVINKIGKDYAEVIANDPEITRPGGVLDRLKERYGIGRGSAGISGADRQASGSDASEGGPAGGEASTDTTQLAKTAERIRGQISESKIKKPAAESPEDDSFNFGANVAPKPAPKSKGKFNALDLIRGLDALKKPAPKK